MSLDDLYRQVLMDHYQHPRNRGALESASVSVGLHNPSCGDVLQLYLKIEGDRVQQASFTGQGCSISMSGASIMTETIRGQTLEQVHDLAEDFKRMVRGEADVPDLGELEALRGVRQFPMRIKCATLAFNALEKALQEHSKQGGDPQDG